MRTPSRLDPLPLRIVDGIALALALIAAGALVLLAVNVFVDVIGRAFVKTPLRGTLEMTAHWWMPALTLLAFAYTEKRQEHIKVTILLDILPVGLRRWVEGCFGIAAALLIGWLCWHALHEALDSFGYRETTSSLPPVAIWPFKFVAVLGLAALTLQMAATGFRHMTGRLPDPATPERDGEAV